MIAGGFYAPPISGGELEYWLDPHVQKCQYPMWLYQAILFVEGIHHHSRLNVLDFYPLSLEP
jgi:hypothetical protein